MLRIEGTCVPVEDILCPKQGVIAHDMIHYAVEKNIARRGFLSRVAADEVPGYAMAHEGEAEAVERLVECIQAELWSGRGAAAELIALYRLSCAARGHAAFDVSEVEVAAIRREVDDLAIRWAALPIGGSMVLAFAAR
ncbi:hypothetical protein [Gluconacetobacter tumulisoli]|uniref:Uncharacterized protein n=1 Tax=Gluconacetobacter tumulisoli TaxID=1286189 RepID=A0A7W4K7S4_9PROT|nr:hypothetical protein [Gluconacetobacter tumulisoli]MBB2201950.1 hypothetical protein [Gluconacetobacter tumulisoli]